MGNAAIAGRTANAPAQCVAWRPRDLIVRMPNHIASGRRRVRQPMVQAADPKVHYGNDMHQSNCQKTPQIARNRTFQFLFEHLMFEIGIALRSAKAKMKYTNLQAAKKIQHNSTKVVGLT
jgi:hypothetical protein